MSGLLRIRGTIDLAQFWPTGQSDADTSKIEVTVGANAFAWAADGVNFKVTHVYDNAQTVGKQRGPVIKNGKITVRLQGVDAPELHYKAEPLATNRPGVTPETRSAYNTANRHERRQCWAETATLELASMLRGLGTGVLKCEVFSFIDAPNEVVDTYGRVVANIRVGPAFKTDVNLWLVEQGLGFPTFYSSMMNSEIENFLIAMKTAKSKNAFKDYARDTKVFDPNLLYRDHGPANPGSDKGPVLMPKLFRRQVAYRMEKAANITNTSFKAYLQASPDACFALDDFMKAGVHAATVRQFHEFVDAAGLATIKPHEAVFREKFSDVVDQNGKRLTKF